MLAVIQAHWCTINDIPLVALWLFTGSLCVIQPSRVQGYLWFLPPLDQDDTVYLQMSIRVVGQFLIGTLLAPILLKFWQIVLFS